MRWKTICGAKTRKGKPCQRKALVRGKCCIHGGLSTGPKTEEGKKRVTMNLPNYRKKYEQKITS